MLTILFGNGHYNPDLNVEHKFRERMIKVKCQRRELKSPIKTY